MHEGREVMPNPKNSDQPAPQSGVGRAKRSIAIVDFGKAQSRQQIKRLRKGEGKLVSRVESMVDELLELPSMSQGDPPVIVIVVRESSTDSMMRFPSFR
jgi:hypothetical protein